MDVNLSTTTKPIKPSYADNFKRLFGGVHFQFPQFKHDHPPVMNVNEIVEEHYTLGQRIADKVASGMGSWRFIILNTFTCQPRQITMKPLMNSGSACTTI